jgi:hypothetical protein
VWLAILLHERLHIVKSDMGALAQLNGAAHRTANCLEDIRVESGFLARYPLLKATVYRPFIVHSVSSLNPQDRYGSLLKAIILRAYRINLLAKEEWILLFFSRYGISVDDIIARSCRARTTDEVVPYALELDGIIQQYIGLPNVMRPCQTAGHFREASCAEAGDLAAKRGGGGHISDSR